MRPLVSIIVVNHNRADLLAECLNSLLHQTWPRTEIIVVDNASTDSSKEVVTAFPDDRIRFVAAEANLGFAGGNNLGFAHANGEYVALINNDAVADEKWLESLVEALESSEAVGMCASKILLIESGLVDKAGHLIFLDGQNRGCGTGHKDGGRFDLPGEALFPDGCAALYRTRLLDQLKGFDEDFFAYGEDADLGLRARWLGWSCLYVPQAVVYHHHSSTLGAYSPSKVYWVERNRLWLAVKNFPLVLLVLNPILTLYRWAWNLVAALKGQGAAGGFRSRNSLRGLISVLILAYWHGLAGVPGMWRKRLRLRKTRRISDLEFLKMLWRFRISARALAFQDPSNEVAQAPVTGKNQNLLPGVKEP